MNVILSTIVIVIGFVAKGIQYLGAWLDKPPTIGDMAFVVFMAAWFLYLAIKNILENVLRQIPALKHMPGR